MVRKHIQRKYYPKPNIATQAYIGVCPKCKREGTWERRDGFHLFSKYYCHNCKSTFNNPQEMAQGTSVSIRKESREYKSDTHNTRHKSHSIFGALRATKSKSSSRRKKNRIRLI